MAPEIGEKKIKGSKKRPEPREVKELKKIVKQENEVPKQQRHQNQKLMRSMKQRKKYLSKEIQKNKSLGYD